MTEEIVITIEAFGVGELSAPEEVVKALDTRVPLVALAHALVMEPKWVEKVVNNQETEIRKTLTQTAQEELVIPDNIWRMITNVKGWFPVVWT